ncbi:MAG TPA: type VI secretion system tip protein TssI/VgrG [Bryobacteraceae bacterium]
MAYVQTQRRIAITTPLGADALLLRSFAGSEAISQLYRFDLDLLSEKDSLKFDDIVGKNVTLRLFDADGNERKWHGFVSRFAQGPQDRRLTSYRAEMVPWLWFLTRTADCRIFQNKKVPDIIQKIFNDLGFHDFELRLYGNFAPRDYCVQYRETDFNFVSRLMEEEGIYYYFRQDEAKHVLVLANDPAAHEPCPNQATARYDFRGGNIHYEDVVTEWRYEQEFRTGKWSQTDYNFETPSTNLSVTVSGKNAYEIYDYPGEHAVRAEGDRLARIRLQEQTAACVVSEGASGCRHFTAGFKVSLTDHYRGDLNQGYLLTSVEHQATQGGDYAAGSETNEEVTYQNRFRCIPFSVPYRAPRVTPRPFVQGCQTAVVVGPGGEEIYTDKYGRVKVQFYWDREGKRNENSSCWVRVSHPWAGKGWGAISVPRIGQEVIVDFLEGNPDQPIIVGRVYNAEQMPPFGMPGGAVVSGIKSNSTKGGGGFNEISLNDTKGNELINVHAQYDQQKKVEHDERVQVGNDRTESVGHDEKITIGNNRTEKVVANEDITIGANRTEHVVANETINVDGNRTEHVIGNEMISVDATRTRFVAINESVNVLGAQEITVGGLQAITVGLTRAKNVALAETVNIGADQTIDVTANHSLTVGGNQTTTITGDQTIGVTGNQTASVKGNRNEAVKGDHQEKIDGTRKTNVVSNDELKVDKTFALVAADEIAFKAGDASITLKKDGTIVIKGKDITVRGSGKITGKADGDCILKGQNVLHN